MGILKKAGKLFVILTNEDRDIEPSMVKDALLISLPSEEHLHKAIRVLTERFREARFKVILPHTKTVLLADIIQDKDIFRVSQDVNPAKYIEGLDRFRKDAFDLVVILSLNPYLVWKVCRNFRCPKLLYNYCDEWYSIRRKTIYEFLAGIRGADIEKEESRALDTKTFFLKMAENLIKTPLGVIKIVARFINLSLYIGVNMFLLSLKR